jgi:hypothetical protein
LWVLIMFVFFVNRVMPKGFDIMVTLHNVEWSSVSSSGSDLESGILQ